MIQLVWAGVVVFALVRGERVLRDWWRHRYPPVLITEQDVVVPEDIVALAMRESEEWAREQVMQTAKERYVKMQDANVADHQKWNLVRRALGIGELG